MTEAAWGGGGVCVYLSYTSIALFTHKGRQDRNIKAAADERDHGVVLAIALHGLLSCFLREPSTTSPGMAPSHSGRDHPTVGGTLPNQSLVNKMLYRQILWRYFLY